MPVSTSGLRIGCFDPVFGFMHSSGLQTEHDWLFSGFVFCTLSSPLICFYYACQSAREANVVFIVLFCVDTTVRFIQRARLHAVATHVLSLSNEPEIKITQCCSVQRQLQTVGCVL